jgi:uncharacterized protein (TIGR02271 family)
MTDQAATSYEGWTGRTVVDQAGEKLGKVADVFLDEATGRPEWLAVHTGMFANKVSFVPLDGLTERGGEIVVGHESKTVENAPRVEQDADGFLDAREEAELYRYYGHDYHRPASSGQQSDDAMTRSEEELQVGVQRREAGRVRLRKYVVTEYVTQTIPVSREEVRIEREPISDDNRGEALSGPGISEAEHEVVLYEERPVVAKEVVPKERVRLAKDTRTEEQTVSDEVRKEVIETEGDAEAGR